MLFIICYTILNQKQKIMQRLTQKRYQNRCGREGKSERAISKNINSDEHFKVLISSLKISSERFNAFCWQQQILFSFLIKGDGMGVEILDPKTNGTNSKTNYDAHLKELISSFRVSTGRFNAFCWQQRIFIFN